MRDIRGLMRIQPDLPLPTSHDRGRQTPLELEGDHGG